MRSDPVRTPVLPTWFEIHTYAGRPVKIPVPPRSWVLRAPSRSQLKPTRGDQRMFASGSFPLSYCTPLPVSSRKVSWSALAFVNPVSPKIGTSSLRP